MYWPCISIEDLQGLIQVKMLSILKPLNYHFDYEILN